jgi:hypothetical protein
MSYFEHIKDVLADRKNGVGKLLEETLGQEDRCIEFKATAFKPEKGEVAPEFESPGQRYDDYTWNIMKECIAFEKTCGGVIFIGIAEDKKTGNLSFPRIYTDGPEGLGRIPIQSRDDWDRYKRKISEVINKKEKYETTGNSQQNGGKVLFTLEPEKLQKINNNLEFEVFEHQGQFILGILVSPGVNDDYITVKKEPGRTGLLYRSSGKVNWEDDFDRIKAYKRPLLKSYSTKEFLRNIPQPTKAFVGRDKELEDLHRMLSPKQSQRRVIPFLFGPVGIGKNELAFKYCEQYYLEYEEGDSIIINAEFLDSLVDILFSLTEDEDFLQHFNIELQAEDKRPDKPENKEKCVGKIKRSLFDKPHSHILILIKNINNPHILEAKEVSNYLSGRYEDLVHIIATSISNIPWTINEEDIVYPYEVKGLCTEEALELLEKRRSFGNDSRELQAAKDILDILDGHTAFIDAVSSILKNRRYHADLYQMLLAELSSGQLQTFDSIAEALFNKWTGGLSEDQKDILFATAFCPSDNICENSLRESFEKSNSCSLNSNSWDELFRTLYEYSFLTEESSGTGVFSMRNLLLRQFLQKKATQSNRAVSLLSNYIECKLDDLNSYERVYYVHKIANDEIPISNSQMAQIFLSKPHDSFFFKCFYNLFDSQAVSDKLRGATLHHSIWLILQRLRKVIPYQEMTGMSFAPLPYLLRRLREHILSHDEFCYRITEHVFDKYREYADGDVIKYFIEIFVAIFCLRFESLCTFSIFSNFSLSVLSLKFLLEKNEWDDSLFSLLVSSIMRYLNLEYVPFLSPNNSVKMTMGIYHSELEPIIPFISLSFLYRNYGFLDAQSKEPKGDISLKTLMVSDHDSVLYQTNLSDIEVMFARLLYFRYFASSGDEYYVQELMYLCLERTMRIRESVLSSDERSCYFNRLAKLSELSYEFQDDKRSLSYHQKASGIQSGNSSV